MDLLCNEFLLGKGIDEVASLGGELPAEADAYVLIACGGEPVFSFELYRMYKMLQLVGGLLANKLTDGCLTYEVLNIIRVLLWACRENC